jgi:pimeloyl-ACP methyl ester carboxylesterase
MTAFSLTYSLPQMSNVKQALPKSIVFITGTFLGNNCWDDWKEYFNNRGYTCVAPAWPHKYASPEELRNSHPHASMALNRLTDLADYFAAIINALPERPIIIGHGLGGLVVQMLLRRGLGTAGVAIHSFPPPNASLFKFSFLKAWWGAMGFFTSTKKTYMISFRKWKNVITSGMTYEQQKQLYYKYATPESKLVIRDSFRWMAKINFEKKRAPLLFISGSDDQLIPVLVNYDNYKKYQMNNSITDYKEFKGRSHLVFDESAWREEAGFILHWLQEIKINI